VTAREAAPLPIEEHRRRLDKLFRSWLLVPREEQDTDEQPQPADKPAPDRRAGK
jgi:hypothetical protein